MKFDPLHDRILIKPTPPDNFRAGLEVQSEPKSEGTVVSIGSGVPLHNIHLNITGEVSPEGMDKLLQVVQLIEKGRQMRVSVGDYVLFGKYAGTRITLDGEEHIMIREADVFGKLREDNVLEPVDNQQDY